jgi:hypothetical protein
MTFGTPLIVDDYWTEAQNVRLSLLQALLRRGWEVDEPVYLRPWRDASGPRVYHFLLRSATEYRIRLVAVPAGPVVEQFVRAVGLQVIFAAGQLHLINP